MGNRIVFLSALLTTLYLCAVIANIDLIILHIGDVLGRYDETSINSGICKPQLKAANQCLAGLPRVIYEIKRHRDLSNQGKIPKVLFFITGNLLTGTVWNYVHSYKIGMDFINLMAPDAMVLGLHDIDDGIEVLNKFASGIKHTILGCNMKVLNTAKMVQLPASKVIEVNKSKIAVIGFMPSRMNRSTTLKSTVNIFDANTMVTEECNRLQNQNVKVFIVIGCAGFEKGKDVAKSVTLSSVVITSGGPLTFLYNEKSSGPEVPLDRYPVIIVKPNGERVPVVTAYAYGKYLGRLNVTFSDDGDLINFGGQPLYMSSDKPCDPESTQLLEKYRPETDKVSNEKLTKTNVMLEGFLNVCGKRECNLGNLITDSFVAYATENMSTVLWTNYSLAIIHAGSIRAGIDAVLSGGDITKGDIINSMPYSQTMCIFSIRGRDLQKILEFTLRENPSALGYEFLQLSGIHVTVDERSRTQKNIKRIAEVWIRCHNCRVPSYTPLDPKQVYHIVAPDYITQNREDLKSLSKVIISKTVLHNVKDIDILSWYIKRHNPLVAEIGGRIKYIKTLRTISDDVANKNSSPYLIVLVLFYINLTLS